MLFDIYTKEVEIKGEKYTLRPLSGRFIGKLYSIVGKMSETGKEDLSKQFDEETMANMYDLAYETFKASYPDQDEKTISAFVSQNLMLLIEPIVQVNINQPEEK
jgi:hypothetical protein